MSYSKRKLLLLSLIIGGCIVIALLWLSGPKVANRLGWAWGDNFPDHLYYHGRSYSLGLSGCKTLNDIRNNQMAITQIGTVPIVFGSSSPMFAPQDQVESKSVVIQIFVKEKNNCYRTYVLEGSP
jgi:hypothetical protein